jgi:hypothetical protein
MSDRLYAMKTALVRDTTGNMDEDDDGDEDDGDKDDGDAMRTTISSVLAGVIHRRDSCPIRVGCNAIVTFLFLFFHFSHARMLSRILSHTPFDTSPPTAQR